MPSLSDLGQLPKRLVLGRPVRSDRLGESLLPKRLALPIFASDPLSSVAYATQEILIVLTLAGTAFLYLAPWLAIAAVLLLLLTVLTAHAAFLAAALVLIVHLPDPLTKMPFMPAQKRNGCGRTAVPEPSF